MTAGNADNYVSNFKSLTAVSEDKKVRRIRGARHWECWSFNTNLNLPYKEHREWEDWWPSAYSELSCDHPIVPFMQEGNLPEGEARAVSLLFRLSILFCLKEKMWYFSCVCICSPESPCLKAMIWSLALVMTNRYLSGSSACDLWIWTAIVVSFSSFTWCVILDFRPLYLHPWAMILTDWACALS